MSRTQQDIALRNAKGVASRLLRDNRRLREELALAKLKCENRDLLLAILRMLGVQGEALQELLDKRSETIKVEHQPSPYIKSK